ncbi:MAG: hypothetical protein KY469_06295 [Actinobacteria bacterium]|nr:hypothetical protein [Actinomycetota bacterium]
MQTTSNLTGADSPPAAATDEATAVTRSARLCWHAAQICDVLRGALEALHAALNQVGEHTDEIIGLALDIGLAIDALTVPVPAPPEGNGQ